MPLPQKTFTSADYWNLPEGERAELIDGQLYAMAPPNPKHQHLVAQLTWTIISHMKDHHGNCQVFPAPFAVNLDADNKNWIEPDLSVICDKSKITDHGCCGAPDWVIEVVSPSSRKMDYFKKNTLYSEAGVQEYWIVDPQKERTTVYKYEEDDVPTIYSFGQEIVSGIYKELSITIMNLL